MHQINLAAAYFDLNKNENINYVLHENSPIQCSNITPLHLGASQSLELYSIMLPLISDNLQYWGSFHYARETLWKYSLP